MTLPARVELHVNVDHVATLRNARGTHYPDPVRHAQDCLNAGADGITIHLREDRRHIRDADVMKMRQTISARLNLEMAATDEMAAIALKTLPEIVTLVPERREERTTEGGLDVAAQLETLKPYVARLREAGIGVSLFIDPIPAQIDASVAVGASAIELHTGSFAHDLAELSPLQEASKYVVSHAPSLHLAAGHGLNLDNLPALIRGCPEIAELNIGHALVSDALRYGMQGAVRAYRECLDRAKA